jgi:hypothetical protein
MIGSLKFGGNSSNWAWYRTADKSWVAEVLGSVHSKVNGEWVVSPRYYIKVWKTLDEQGHTDYQHPDYDFVYTPKKIPASGDKLTERTLNKTVREHVKEKTDA